jgi:kynureninase
VVQHGPVPSSVPTRAHAELLDAQDPLRDFRDRFVRRDDELVYFDGNSLGRLPSKTVEALSSVVNDEWGSGLVRSWEHWIDLPIRVGDRVGGALLGAAPGQVVVCDTTTANLYKLAWAAAAERPGRTAVVTDDANFPTDRYVLAGVAAARGLEMRVVSADPVDGVTAAAVSPVIDDDVALVTFSHVDYRTAAVAEIHEITDLAHRAGALTLWDLSHAAGAVPVDLDGWGVDLAVGCSYKYLNGGPGAPAWMYVRRGLQERLRPPVWGWFGQEDQFAMGPEFNPAPGMRRWIGGTPPVLGLTAVDVGVSLLEEAGMGAVRTKGIALTTYAAGLAEAWLAPFGFSLASPAEADRRGSHISLRHPEAFRLSRALVQEAEVVPDFRPPDLLRLGLAPLTTSFAEVWDGMHRIRRLASERAWQRYSAARGRVT